MKFRNLLMTAAFLLAVTSTFATKTKRWSLMDLSFIMDGKCYAAFDNTNPLDCSSSYTGAQCTYLGSPAYFYDPNTLQPPTCTIPLRRH